MNMRKETDNQATIKAQLNRWELWQAVYDVYRTLGLYKALTQAELETYIPMLTKEASIGKNARFTKERIWNANTRCQCINAGILKAEGSRHDAKYLLNIRYDPEYRMADIYILNDYVKKIVCLMDHKRSSASNLEEVSTSDTEVKPTRDMETVKDIQEIKQTISEMSDVVELLHKEIHDLQEQVARQDRILAAAKNLLQVLMQ